MKGSVQDPTPVIDISGAAGAWQRGFEAGKKAGSAYTAIIWGAVGFILGVIAMGVMK